MTQDIEARVQSVKKRLENAAKELGIASEVLFVRYGNERFLARLSRTPYVENLILKGGMALHLVGLPYTRPTKDIDFLGRGIANTVEQCIGVIKTIAQVELSDGLKFDPNSITHEPITEDTPYPGVRLKLVGFMGRTKFPITIDLGFGDATVPERPLTVTFPQLLECPEEIQIRAYSCETIIAEKFEVLVELAQTNSRMKDIFDLYTFCTYHDFEGPVLAEAIQQTFLRRKQNIIASPLVFREQYISDGTMQTRWKAYLRKQKLEDKAPGDIQDALARIQAFLSPLCGALERGESWPYIWRSSLLCWEKKAPIT